MIKYILQNLNEKKEINIGYFGGSITEGAGASADNKCWRSLITKWFKDEYPQCKVDSINAAIGGTGTELGVFRCDRDLISHKPDLVFVEFAVNDYGFDDQDIMQNMEGIVRKIKKALPKTDIIFILMVTNKMGLDDYDVGNVPHSVKIHELVAEHYDIPVFNAGKVLWDKIRAENIHVEKFLPDMVHPSDDGYAIYAQAIKTFLKNEIENSEMKEKVLPNPICEKSLERATLVDSFAVNAGGWNKEGKTLNGRYPRYISSNTPGAEFEFDFEGDSIGLYWMIAHDSGDIEWSVDASPWEHKSSWDEYALEFDRANWTLLKKDLSRGKHTLKVKVSAKKHEQSDGNCIRIGAFLVNH